MNAESSLTLDYFDTDSSLIYGIGNIGRQDDGLGWAFIDWLETISGGTKADKVKFYQLNLEDADLISHKQRVLFVDASKDSSVDSFHLYKAEPKMDFSFTSHAMSIETIMATCSQCFGKVPEVYVLAIRGYEWELQLGLTEQAENNLSLATKHMCRVVMEPPPKASLSPE
jgi:hydrogenase maturation protease